MEQIASNSLPDILRASYDCIHAYGPCHMLLIRMNMNPQIRTVYVNSFWSEKVGFPAPATPSTDSSRVQRAMGIILVAHCGNTDIRTCVASKELATCLCYCLVSTVVEGLLEDAQ